MPTLPDRLAGGVWGHLVGDAMGVPYEFREPSQISEVVWGATGSHRRPPGTWSDDGALMLATLDSLLSAGFDPSDQGRRFLDWFDGTAYTPDGEGKFDWGGATSRSMSRLQAGVPAEEAGGTTERDLGNGSLMRILPIALVERDVPDAVLVEHAERSSAVTHGHPVAQVTCALYCLTARQLLADEEPDAAMVRARATLRELVAGDAVRLAALERIEGHTRREGRGGVVDAFWSAWDAFAGASSYQTIIERAIRYGHDTDTTACIAGGLAGIRWGMRGIPGRWLRAMRGQPMVVALVDGLIEVGA